MNKKIRILQVFYFMLDFNAFNTYVNCVCFYSMCRHRKFQQNEILKEILIMVSLGIRKERGGGGYRESILKRGTYAIHCFRRYCIQLKTPLLQRRGHPSKVGLRENQFVPFLSLIGGNHAMHIPRIQLIGKITVCCPGKGFPPRG